MESPNEHQTVEAALVLVMRAGEQLVADRLAVALAQARRLLAAAALEVALTLLGGLVVVVGLILFDIAVVDRLRQYDPRSWALAYCALVHGLIGGAVLFVALRSRRVTAERP